MNAYFIERPEVSNGLRRTYFKKLEVFGGAFTDSRTNQYTNVTYFPSFKADCVYSYNAKKGIWVKKPCDKYFTCNVLDTGILNNAEIGKSCAYSSLEAACAAKLILINRMAETYKKELQALQELFDRNVPDIQQPLNQLLETHPDLFI